MIKKGVQLYGIQPEMVICHIEINKVFLKFGVECIPTSIVGKIHKKGSLHPVGYAIDYRTKHIKDTLSLSTLLAELKEALPQCDFLLEDLGGEQEHIHAEYDPKDDKLFQETKAKYKLNGEWLRG